MDSPQYAHLAAWYDRLFPLDPDALSLVVELAGPPRGQSIVDVGCGTGLLVRALAAQGYWAFGFDRDASLLAVALSPPPTPGATFASGDLRNLSLPEEFLPPALITCLGNTLPHLTESREVDDFFGRVRDALSPGGVFLMQTLNYDLLEREARFDLPDRTVEGTVFRRSYQPRPDGLWDFCTSLDGPWGQSKGRFPLRPWKYAEWLESLSRAGFRVVEAWGGFDRRPVGSSLPLVLSARVS